MTSRSEAKALLARRQENGRSLNEERRARHKPRDLLDSDMLPGEQMIWAAAYTDEYRRALTGAVPYYNQRLAPLEAAEFASLYALDAVKAARRALQAPPGTVSEEAKDFLKDMLSPKKKRG